MKKSIVALLLMITLFSCKKEEPKQYSTWYVNGQKFITNDVTLDKGKARCDLFANNQDNKFYIIFNISYLPTSLDLPIVCGINNNPSYCCLHITYNKNVYQSHNGILHASLVNNRAQYAIDSTWFYSGNDSILVKGKFNEP